MQGCSFDFQLNTKHQSNEKKTYFFVFMAAVLKTNTATVIGYNA
jgi:hypothetical protein